MSDILLGLLYLGLWLFSTHTLAVHIPAMWTVKLPDDSIGWRILRVGLTVGTLAVVIITALGTLHYWGGI